MANIVNSAYGYTSVPVYTSAARTATPDTQEFTELGPVAGLALVIDVTAVTATPSVTFRIQGVDRASGKTWDILTSAAITAVGTTVLRVGPGITATANVAVSDVIPPIIRITATHGDADSITYIATLHLMRGRA